MPFDALGYAQKLQEAGVPRDQATAQASYLRDAFIEQERTLATKADLAELRAELKSDMAGLRADFAELKSEVRTEIAEVRTEIAEVRTEIAEVRTEISGLRTEMRMEISGLQTEMRTEISGLRTDFAQLEARLTKWMLAAAGVGGLLGGAVSVAARLLIKP